MDNNIDIATANLSDSFRLVCKDNIIALKDNQTIYIYKYDVLQETIDLCIKKGIKYEITKEDDYYIVRNKNKKSEVE